MAASSCLLGGPKEGGNPTSTHSLRDPQTKGDKIRIGCLTLAFSGAQKRAKMLHHPCSLGDPQTKGDEIRGCLTPGISGAQKMAKMLRHPCILWGPKTKGGQNQKWPPHPCLLTGPEEGGSAMPPLHSRGSPTPSTETKSEVAHGWAHCLQACIVGKIGNFFFAVKSCNFFIFAVKACRRKSSHRVISFCSKSCNSVFAENVYKKKIVTSWRFFFCGKRVYKKIIKPSNVFLWQCMRRAYATYRKNHYTTRPIFLLRAFTAKKKMHELQHTLPNGLLDPFWHPLVWI